MNNIKKVEVKCVGLNNQGQGIAILNKKEILVPYLLPKEVGLIELENGSPSGRLIKVLKPSSSRNECKCKVFNKCGSCHLLHMNYEDQIALKKQWVSDCFKKEKLNIKINEFILAKSLVGYRNKMQVAFKMRDNNLIYGFYEEASHRVIPLSECMVQTARQNEICNAVLKIMKELKIAPYNEDKRVGVIRFVLIREAFKTNQILVTIVTNGEIFPARSEFVKRLRAKCPYITTIIQNYNSRKTSIILGDNERVLFGNGYIEDYLCDIKFQLSSKTFFQVNPVQAENLYNKALQLAEFAKDDIIIDAYCGVGTIGMIASKNVKEVYGVESNKTSIQCARSNASLNKINNIKFVNADATEYLVDLAKNNAKVDGLIMDPPRSGSTVAFLEAVKKLKPKKVVYISCGPDTLARDLKCLLTDYEVKGTALVDMFVGTYHVESIVALSLKK